MRSPQQRQGDSCLLATTDWGDHASGCPKYSFPKISDI